MKKILCFYLLFLLILLCSSCDTKTNIDKKYLNLLENPLTSKYNSTDADIVLINTYLRLKDSMYVDTNEIIKTLDQIQSTLSGSNKYSEFYQDVTILKNNLILEKGGPSISFYDHLIDSLSAQPYNDVSIIKVLNEKAKILGYTDSEYNYAFSTALYAEYLRSRLSKQLKSKTYYIPWSIIGTFHEREGHVDQARFFYKLALQNQINESPGKRFIRYQYTTLNKKIDALLYDSICATFIDSTQTASSVNEQILTDLSTKVDDSLSIQFLTEEIEKSNSYCEDFTFFQVNYLIDSYLNLKDVESAKHWLTKLSACDLDSISIENFLFQDRNLKFIYALYLKTKEDKYLPQIIENTQALIQLYFNYGKELINEHYADVAYRSNEYLVKAIYEQLRSNRDINPNNIITQLSSIKVLYNKISDSKSILGNREMDEKDMATFSNLKYELEKLEVKTKRYKDTLLTNLSIYEKLYALHKSIYTLKLNYPQSKKTFNTLNKLSLNQLPDSVQIIDFVKTDSTYFISSITNNHIHMHAISTADLNSSVEVYLNNFSRKKLKEDFTFNTKLDRLLSLILDTTKSEIIIVPDGKIFDIPLEPLIQNSKNHSTPFNVSYQFSIDQVFKSKSFSIPPTISLYSYSDSISLSTKKQLEIPELPIGFKEIRNIQSLYPNSYIYSGSTFSEAQLKNQTNSSILHFSTHSKSNKKNPLDNYLIAKTKENTPSLIYGFALKRYNFKDKLIVLSSCESGLGNSKPGTGVFSLSRDFLQTGAQTVIKSLWSVNESSTSELMYNFHTHLIKGHHVSQALRLAKEGLKQNPIYAHPYYWAGFILEGNPNVKLNPNFHSD